MQYQYFVVVSGLVEWLLLSISLFVIAPKLEWKKRWPAWIPGYRIYCLGDSVGLSKEGMYCGIMDILFINSIIADFAVRDKERIGTLASLIHLVLFIFLFMALVLISRLYIAAYLIIAVSQKSVRMPHERLSGTYYIATLK